MIVDRVSRKRAILGGLYAWSAICIATVASFDFKHLLFWRAAEGLGETFYYPGVDVARQRLSRQPHPLARDGPAPDQRLHRHHRRRLLRRVSSASTTAGACPSSSSAASASCSGLVLQRLLVEPPRGAADRAEAAAHGHAVAAAGGGRLPFGEFLRLVGRTPTLLCLMGAFMCANFVAVVLLSWMPKFLYDRFGMGLAMSGLTATIFVQLASMVGAPIGGWLADCVAAAHAARTPGRADGRRAAAARRSSSCAA